MSTHIGARPGDIAPLVLMPGDPLRAKWIAETFLDDPQLYNEVRGMPGWTGTWRGQRVSVQGSGMGQPTLAIYVNELFGEYDVQSIIRVGSCGALTDGLAVRDIVIASGACTDSFYNPRPELTSRMAEYGVLAIEMEASALYTLAARYGRKALAINTVADHVVTGEETSSLDREQTFGRMVEIALDAGLSQL